jgi:hypothetical protein
VSRLAPLLGLLLVLLLAVLAAPARSATVAPDPLDTLITGGPGDGEAVYDDTVTFEFAATGQGAESAGFQCSLDGDAGAPCASGQTYEDLADGPHSFSVYAEDPTSGLRDAEPARVAFRVDEVVCEESGEGDDEDEGQEEAEEEGGCEEEAAGDLPPRECVLRTARASALANLVQGRLRVTVRYTAFEAGDATVDARLGSGHAAPRLLLAHRHLAKQGRLVLSADLSKGELAKLRGKRIGLELAVPGSPSSCARYGDRSLVPRPAGARRVVWTQPRP